MCEFAPAGDVGGMTTVVVPKNVLGAIPGPWQVAHPLVTPVWSIWPPAKVVKPFRVDATWQAAHPALVGRWLAGLPVASVPLWQLTQLPITWP